MTYTVLETSTNAISLLNRQSSWAVHSIYHNTINLKSPDNLVSLQAKDSVLSPISITLPLCGEEISFLPISNDTIFLWDKENMTFSIKDTNSFKLVINEQTKILNLDKPCSIDKTHIARLYSNIATALSANNTSAFNSFLFDDISNSDDLIEKKINVILNDTLNHLKSLDYINASLSLCRLIGLGKGLTPSGDDFICGFIAGFYLLGISNHPLLKELLIKLPDYLQNTNDISREFLNQAISHRFSIPVISLSEMICSEEIANAFSPIGHSSGMDTLSGILFVIKTIEY